MTYEKDGVGTGYNEAMPVCILEEGVLVVQPKSLDPVAMIDGLNVTYNFTVTI